LSFDFLGSYIVWKAAHVVGFCTKYLK